MYKNEKQNIQQIRYLLQELPSKFLDVGAVNIIAMLLSFTLDVVMDVELIPLLIFVVKETKFQLHNRIIADIENAKFMAQMTSVSHQSKKQSPLIDFIMNVSKTSELRSDLLNLLYIQQRVLVREAMKEFQNDQFSSVKIYKAQTNSVTPLDFFSDYLRIIVNKFATILGTSNSVNDLLDSLCYNLFCNLLLLIWGIMDSHAISQIALPPLCCPPWAFGCLY